MHILNIFTAFLCMYIQIFTTGQTERVYIYIYINIYVYTYIICYHNLTTLNALEKNMFLQEIIIYVLILTPSLFF